MPRALVITLAIAAVVIAAMIALSTIDATKPLTRVEKVVPSDALAR